ncbi:Inosine-uridine preferring nucleoside hydrolase [Acidisarcina polymorpha]|uniref:Inosine-uridine preferring nucleoside hydrolase n=1 Tax=Acidisarcina polymorpha TaxID=2211140 RepID=A0A2Z5G9M1_9BACT|nr:nucleoside hydrolase [Acidisarcina polymorpha]AXC15256.1 Inosine-uridine preferring nucleoside hydrolase [Acidisarcina polymorpha]
MLGLPKRALFLAAFLLCLTILATKAFAQAPQLVIIDTDIGDDIDDVLAIGLALSSPELKILGIESAWGDTALRARMLDRLLCETGRADIPVAVGIEKHGPGGATFSQARWAERQPEKTHTPAVDFLLDQIKQHPGEITLIGIAPLTNLAAALQRDPNTFRKLKRIVIMGGSIHRGYDDLGYTPDHGPDAEYNIAMDPAAAQAIFHAGVPLFVMPLDSTQLKLDEVKRRLLFTQSTDLTDALALLYEQWSRSTSQVTPTMFDAVAAAYSIEPALCPTTPMNVDVDARGYTRQVAAQSNVHANANVCLSSDSDGFFAFYMPRLLKQKLAGSCAR